MDMLKTADEIIKGRRLSRNDDLEYLLSADLDELCKGADIIRRHFKGRHTELCSIINGRSGRCSEDCKFCAQSSHHCTGINEYGFLDSNRILAECKHNESMGVHRFAIVTAGRSVSGEDFEKALQSYDMLKRECSIGLCASHGLLTQEQFIQLKNSGVSRYHANIETSKRYFPYICSTHTFDDKLECIRRAKNAGLEVCSGGIIGMGETWDDRLDMALTLLEMGVVSVPINALIPIKGTALECVEPITENDIIRTAAIFRFILPDANIRLAAGRDLMENCGEKAFLSGVDSAITGDMLTTSGNRILDDIAMLKQIGFAVEGVTQ